MYVTILLVIDQVAKWLAKSNLQPSSVKVLISNILGITYLENRGAAFGMMNGKQVFLIVFTIIAVIFMLYYYNTKIKKEKSILGKIALNLLIAGAIGNLVDRILLGYVIDFIKLEFIEFPVFNIADCYINLGCFFMILYILFDSESKTVKKKEAE